MQRKQSAILELHKILESGYKIQQEQDIFQIQRVPRNDEPGFSDKSFGDYLKQGANGSNVYWKFTDAVKTEFEKFGLSFGRFRNKTESINPTTEPDSPAGLFTRQLKELDHIINDSSYFDSYVIATNYPEVTFEDGVVSQGYQQHRFNSSSDQHRALISLLWDGRKITTTKGQTIKQAKPLAREDIYTKLGIKYERFKDIVRAIELAMKRKDILLDIKFPNDVYIVVKQDTV